MYSSKSWAEGWRRFLGLSTKGKALDVLLRLYVEESQHASIFAQHASRMHYPQFRAKLLEIAARETKHIGWIGEKIALLGGSLPVVPQTHSAGGNSWEFLLADLEDESRCAGELLEQAMLLEADFPAIADMLRRIYEEEQKHRDEIREMLMRSDPLSMWAA
jgi:bacterioferritin (cytochrome b1)